MSASEAVDLLYSYLGALPGPEGSTINLLPWGQESEGTDKVKRMVCESIIQVLEPHLKKDEPEAPAKNILVSCRSCGGTLLSLPVVRGVANAPGPYLLQTLKRLSTVCPHTPETLDDQRRRIEEALGE